MIFLVYFGAMPLLAGTILIISALGHFVMVRSYENDSESVMATVANKWIHEYTHKSSRSISYLANVSYTVGGIAYEQRLTLTQSAWEKLSEGGQIELRYKPSNPKRSVTAESLTRDNTRVLLIAGIVVTVIGGAMCAIGLTSK